MDIINKIESRYKWTFISTFIVGVLTHGMALFNKFSLHDDVDLFGVGATYTSGRWMLDIFEIAERFIYGDGHYSLPAYNGILGIVCIALCSCIIVSMLDIQTNFLCALAGISMVTFPVIASLFGYVFTLHFYMIALLMSIAGAFCICKCKNIFPWILGAVLIGCAVGVYQAYLPITLGVMLLCYISGLFNDVDDKIFAKSLLEAVRIVVFAGCSLLFYFAVNKIYLNAKNAVLTDYEGISSMGKSSLGEYILRAIESYKDFFIYPADARYTMFPGRLALFYTVAIIICVVLSVIVVKKLIAKNVSIGLLAALAIAVIPLCTNFIYVMASAAKVHSLMVYGQVLPLLYLIWLIDNLDLNFKSLKSLANAASLLIIIIAIMFCRFDNKLYLKAALTQQQSISYFTTLITQIKSAEGYSDEFPVAFVNARHISDKSLMGLDELTGVNTMPYFNVENYINDYVWLDYMRNWCGYKAELADAAQFETMEEVANMPSYPDYGSIKVIEDTVVVKF